MNLVLFWPFIWRNATWLSDCHPSFLGLSELLRWNVWFKMWISVSLHSLINSVDRMISHFLQAMAALNTRKMKFSPLKGSFSEKGLNEFLLWVYFVSSTRVLLYVTSKVMCQNYYAAAGVAWGSWYHLPVSDVCTPLMKVFLNTRVQFFFSCCCRFFSVMLHFLHRS